MKIEYAIRGKISASIPEWLAADFERRKDETRKISDPVKRRLAEIDIDRERDEIKISFLERASLDDTSNRAASH